MVYGQRYYCDLEEEDDDAETRKEKAAAREAKEPIHTPLRNQYTLFLIS